MGIDLRLLVADGNCGDWGYSHTVLSLDRNYDIWGEIERRGPIRRPGFKFSTFFGRTIPDGSFKDERGYGEITETPYGEPLTFLHARQIADAMSTMKLSPMNAAILAFLKALPPDVSVGLYWH